MKYIFLNIKNFLKKESLIFLIMIISVFSSSVILNFSYGLYQNYTRQKYETEINLKDLNPEVKREFSKKELQNFTENLSAETLNKMVVIYAQGKLNDYLSEEGEPLTMPTRFTYQDGKYSICYETRENWKENGLIPFGRYINEDEEAEGKNVAIIPYMSGSVGNIKKAVDNHNIIKLFGKEYKVVGCYKAGSSTPIVPFLTIPDDFKYNGFGITFFENVTRKEYDEIVSVSSEYIPDAFIFPELELPDNDTIYMYNNIIFIAVFISIITIINFGMLYMFILKKRSNEIAIIRLCGATKLKTVMIFLSECLAINIPVFLLGIICFEILLRKVFSNVFIYMEEFFNIKVYFIIFLLYLLLMIFVLGIMIFRTINKKIVNVLKEVRI